MLLFDLDNTLYSADLAVVARIDRRINEYMVTRLGIDPAGVDAMRRRFWAENGTTLHGLMRHHRVDPDDYLGFVHDLDLSDLLRRDESLRGMLGRLRRPRAVLTNASRSHARNVLGLLGIEDCFDAVITLEDLDYVPKPHARAFETGLARLGASAEECVLVEDSLPNLIAAKGLGMRTVWVAGAGGEHAVDHVIATVHEIEAVLEGSP